MLVVIKEVCDGGGEQGGLRFAALSKDFSTSLDVGLLQHSKSGGAIRPSKLFLCFLCRPASSIQAPLPSLFVKLLCLRL